MSIKSQLAFSIIRWVLTSAGMYLGTKGYINGDATPVLVGAIMSTMSLAWSAIHHTTTVSIPKSAVASVDDPRDRYDPPH